MAQKLQAGTDETISMPIFPLRTVLFPGGVLPLRIFEPRYVDMIRWCMREQANFGVVLLRQGGEVIAGADASEAEAARLTVHVGFSGAAVVLIRPRVAAATLAAGPAAASHSRLGVHADRR